MRTTTAAVLVCLPGVAVAASGVQEHRYLDCDAGTNGSGTSSSPYNNLAAGVAALDGGAAGSPDYLYIKGTCTPCASLPNGDCSDNYNSATIILPASHIYLTTWPGEPMAYIDGGTSPTGDVLGVSSWSRTDMTIDGLNINGHMTIRGVKNFTLKNCLVHGAGHLDHANLANPADSELMLLQDIEGALFQNNKFFDNDGENDSRTTQIVYFGRNSGDTNMGVVFEFNEFFETSSAPKKAGALFLKDNADHVVVRYNYFHDLRGNAVFGANQNGPGRETLIHNNIFERCGDIGLNKGAVELWIQITGWQVSNNTFVENNYAAFWNRDVNTNWHLFNNLFVESTSKFVSTGWCGSTGSNAALESTCDYLDYNAYYGSGTWANDQGTHCDTESSLSGWQTYLAGKGVTDVHDSNSVDVDPVLADLATHDTSDDFKLTAGTPSSIRTGGRGGAHPTYIGAWAPDAAMWIGYCPAGVGGCDSGVPPQDGGTDEDGGGIDDGDTVEDDGAGPDGGDAGGTGGDSAISDEGGPLVGDSSGDAVVLSADGAPAVQDLVPISGGCSCRASERVGLSYLALGLIFMFRARSRRRR